MLFGIFICFGLTDAYAQETVKKEICNESYSFINEALLDSGEVFCFLGIYFQLGWNELIDSNSAAKMGEVGFELSESTKLHLFEIANYLERYPNYIVEISVHTDCRGSQASSRRLSQGRAEAIVAALVQLGIDARRLIPKGYEATHPYIENGVVLSCEYIKTIPKNEQSELHQKNRKVGLKVLSKDYSFLER